MFTIFVIFSNYGWQFLPKVLAVYYLTLLLCGSNPPTRPCSSCCEALNFQEGQTFCLAVPHGSSNTIDCVK